MSFHPELAPSVQTGEFFASRKVFNDMILDTYATQEKVDKLVVLSAFARVIMTGAEAVASENMPALRYGLSRDRYAIYARHAYTNVVALNGTSLVQPPLEDSELAILKLFVDQADPETRR